MRRRSFPFAALALGVTLLAASLPGYAQDFPNKPIRIIVPYGTGGGSDTLARQIAVQLQTRWNQGVVVDNRAGASGNIGTEAVVRAPADGYTWLLQNSTMVVNPAVGGKLKYDPEKDLLPVMLLGQTPMALVAHPSAGLKSFKDLVAQAKAKPQTLNYASCGIGTPQHFVMELTKQKAGFDANHVAYKGCAPGLADLLGGQVQLAVLSGNLVAPHVKTGRLQALAVSTSSRYEALADVPTLEELGLKPFNVTIWYALMLPAKTPPDIVSRIQAEVRRILDDPETKAKLSAGGVEPMAGNAADLAALIKSDLAYYAAVAKSANIKGE